MNINNEIADRKGLEVFEVMGKAYKIDRSFDFPISIPIDYTKDPKLILELVLELLDDGWTLSLMDYGYEWEKIDRGMTCVTDNSIGLVTAMAWCEMKGIDYE